MHNDSDIARSQLSVHRPPPARGASAIGLQGNQLAAHALSQHASSSLRARSAIYLKATIAYLLQLMFGSHFPFDQWDAARGGLHAWLSPLWPAHLSRSDVVTNLVVYIPFGLFMALAWSRRTSPRMKIALITLGGLVFCLCLVFLQSYLFARVLQGQSEFAFNRAVSYALDVLALGLLAATLVRPDQRLLRLFSAFVAAVLLIKVPVVGRQLSLEAIVGAGGALLVLPLLLRSSRGLHAVTAGVMLLLSYALEQLHRGDELHATLHAMNWIPFSDQMEDLGGFEDIVAGVWPFAALAYFALLARRT